MRDVSFTVGEGEFVGLIGPNGCGKSTTFNCISGLLDQTSGSIEIFGEDASELRPDQIQQLGMPRAFQHTNLWREMTVIENLLVPPRGQFGSSIGELAKSLLFPANPAEEGRLSRAYEVLDQLEVPHMAHRRLDHPAGTEIALDRFGLGRGFDDDQVGGHGDGGS